MRWLLLSFLSMNLAAVEIDSLLLKAEATIFPKIILLDQDIKDKAYNNRLTLDIIYTADERDGAEELKSMIDTEHKHQLGEFVFETRLVNSEQFEKRADVSAYYVFDASTETVKTIIAHAAQTRRICFGYYYKDRETLVSMHVKEKTYIYLNKAALREYRVSFLPIFYKLAKVR